MSKRAFDVILATLALVVLWPFGLLVATAIKLDSRGPVFFRHARVGQFGREFLIHKFRTMHVDAPRQGLELTVDGDPRITRVGRTLRRWRLDEWPQLIDVLLGHMSLVGPRPEVPRYAAAVPQPLRDHWLAFKPGMTDPASLAHIDEDRRLATCADPERVYIDEILPTKVHASIEYASTATRASDLRVIWQTARRLVQA